LFVLDSAVFIKFSLCVSCSPPYSLLAREQGNFAVCEK